jgi:hypothetical protein
VRLLSFVLHALLMPMRGRELQFADIADFDVDCLKHKGSVLLGVAFKVTTGPSLC